MITDYNQYQKTMNEKIYSRLDVDTLLQSLSGDIFHLVNEKLQEADILRLQDYICGYQFFPSKDN